MRQSSFVLACSVMIGAFATSASAASFGDNLVTNGDAETGDTSGFSTTGGLEALSYSYGGGYPVAGDPGVAQGGNYFFEGGYTTPSTGLQSIDLSSFSAAINGGTVSYSLSALLGGYASQSDNAVLSVNFLGAGSSLLGGASIGPVTPGDRGNATGLLERSTTGFVPVGTLSADVLLTLTRFEGSANDGYADNLSLVLQQNSVPAAPEPATWAMMVGGFGVMGAAMRRRGRANVRLA